MSLKSAVTAWRQFLGHSTWSGNPKRTCWSNQVEDTETGVWQDKAAKISGAGYLGDRDVHRKCSGDLHRSLHESLVLIYTCMRKNYQKTTRKQ